MISFSSVTKRFNDKVVLKSVSFSAKEGEVIGFLGPNGAGKTTTMRMLLGYLFPSVGKVSVDGKNPSVDRLMILKDTGYLPENNPLYADMTVTEYLAFVRDIKGSGDIDSLVDEVGLRDVINRKIEELSRGYKQRVGLAAALLGEPKLIILDEPTSGLDPVEQDRIKTLIKGLSKKRTIIFSTHILSEVEDIATRLIIIHRGSVVYDGVKPKGRGSVEKLFKKLIKQNDEVV